MNYRGTRGARAGVSRQIAMPSVREEEDENGVSDGANESRDEEYNEETEQGAAELDALLATSMKIENQLPGQMDEYSKPLNYISIVDSLQATVDLDIVDGHYAHYTKDNTADIWTKPLHKVLFLKHRDAIVG